MIIIRVQIKLPLGRGQEKVLSLAKEKTLSMDRRTLLNAAENYGGARAKKFFAAVLADGIVGHA